MNKDKLKKQVSLEVLNYISSNIILGVGTGSTVSYFIDFLIKTKKVIKGIVSSSIVSEIKLRKSGIPILDSKHIDCVDIYIDGADEFNLDLVLIKGGGGALTKEKIIASMSKKFIVIVDYFKQVDLLGDFPLPVEIIPMAFSYVFKELSKLGGTPKYRNNFITDNGNIILDVYNLKIINPVFMENKINNIPGVVEVGLFSKRRPDLILMSTLYGIKKFFPK